MGQEIVYCSVCGERISATDLEKGRAVIVLRKHFCKTCAVTVVRESSEGTAHDPTKTPSPLKIRTRRVPLADKPSAIIANRIPFLIAAAIVLAALTLLLYILLVKQG